MALDFDTQAPTVATAPLAKRTATRTAGDNPFVSRGWLLESYNEGKTMDFVAEGGYETYQRKTKAEDGTVVLVDADRMGGDAGVVTAMLRRAADELNIGVTIQYAKGPRKGTVIVKYLGKARKAAPAAKAENA